MERIFLLSPASASGKRAGFLLNPEAEFDLARRLRAGQKVPIAEVFSFLSGLYFRGKYTYAKHFARPPRKVAGAWVITPNRGLLEAETPIGLEEIISFGSVNVDLADKRYIKPLIKDAKRLARALPRDCEVVLLGSISTNKYVSILHSVFGKRFRFPVSFIGRGDMSRGSLLLECARENRELEYAPIPEGVSMTKRVINLRPQILNVTVLDEVAALVV
jgi:hypothetical protein